MLFSILQSVYQFDNPDFLNLSLQSIANNTVLPDEIILVKDGKITKELEIIITEWQRKLPIKVVGYEKNYGLAYALNYGLKFVKNDLVARMDSDDICCPDRFEKQISYFEANPDVVLISGYIDEFDDNPEKIVSTRKVPLEYSEICKYLKKRSAFNHMAVMFKKSAVMEAGNYQKVPCFEDYDLWIRIVQKNYKVANLPDALVKARIGNDMIGRRHGFSYAKNELFFLKRQLKSGFITLKEYLELILLRVSARLLPKPIIKIIYKILRHL